MTNRSRVISLLLMAAVLAASVVSVFVLRDRLNGLAAEEADLRAQIEDSATGPNGYNTIDNAKVPLWEQRDALLAQEKELQTRIQKDYEEPAQRVREQIAVVTGYQARRDQALARTALVTWLTDELRAVSAPQEDPAASPDSVARLMLRPLLSEPAAVHTPQQAREALVSWLAAQQDAPDTVAGMLLAPLVRPEAPETETAAPAD